MKIEISKIILQKSATPKPQIEVVVKIAKESTGWFPSGNLTVFLDYNDLTISEIETEATKKAKEFLADLANS